MCVGSRRGSGGREGGGVASAGVERVFFAGYGDDAGI
jgi:hypothetical protein